jgi:hypothetical protein
MGGGVLSFGGSGGMMLGSGGGTAGGCSDDLSSAIFLLGWQGGFYRFEPQTGQVSLIAQLACPGEIGNLAFSMSVDRSGTAWALFSSGQLFNVDTVTGVCTATGYAPNQAAFDLFGMGFVSDGPNTNDETLYVSHIGYFTPPAKGLGSIDTQALTLAPIAQYDLLAQQNAEMTGTGDGRLYGFFQTVPTATIAEIEPSSAAIVSQSPVAGLPVGTSYAFAFWGGDFWVFTGPQIRQFKPSDQSVTLIVADTGFDIVGAGVSTCAPVEPPS